MNDKYIKNPSKLLCFIVNLFGGVIGIIACAIIYSFIFEIDNPEHSIGLGIITLLVALSLILCPNLLFYFKLDFKSQDVIIYQILPFFMGGLIRYIYTCFI